MAPSLRRGSASLSLAVEDGLALLGKGLERLLEVVGVVERQTVRVAHLQLLFEAERLVDGVELCLL